MPELPQGELDYSEFLEFGNVDVMTHGGYVFVWERDPSIMIRFSVKADLSLEQGPRVSFANLGSIGVGRHVFISETRAYTLSTALDGLVVWNPQTMEVIGSIPMTAPDVDPSLDLSVAQGLVAGDQVIWPISWSSYDTHGIQDATVAIASATANDALRFEQDARCVGAGGAHVDESGDFHLFALADWGYQAAYGERAAERRACVLRIQRGGASFDPAYLRDLRDLTDTYVNHAWYHVRGSKYLAYSWDPALPVPANPDDFWSAPLRPLLVDLETQTSAPYPYVGSGPIVTSRQFDLDGVPFHELSETASDVGAFTEVVELREDGAPVRFTITSGNLWALGRIRR